MLHVIFPTKSCKINILEMLSIANHFISTCIFKLLLRVFSQPNISLRSLELLRQRGKDHRALLNVLVFSRILPSPRFRLVHCDTLSYGQESWSQWPWDRSRECSHLYLALDSRDGWVADGTNRLSLFSGSFALGFFLCD